VQAAEPKTPPVTKLPQGVPEARLDYAPGKAPALWSVALAESIMARHPDFRRAYWKPWNYAAGYVLCDFERIYRANGDRRYMEYVKKYVDNFVDADGKFHGSKLDNLDDFMAGTSIVATYDYTHDERYKTAATQIRKAFDPYPRTDGQFWHNAGGSVMWIDGVFMGQMLAVRYGASIGDSGYCFDEAAKQILTCARHSEKGKSGLYLHAWTDQPAKYKQWADPKTGVSPEVWSEGLGWYALVVVDALAAMPKDHPQRAAVEDVYRRLAAGLQREQDPQSGGWFMIVDKGDQPGNWIDPSGTAMFVYTLQRGIELGLLDAKEYLPVVERAYKKLLTFASVNERGLVDIAGGGDGIGIKNNFADYVKFRRQVNAKETVGGFLWAATIMERPQLEAMRRR
jgi:unsaturated rhamnogalacturonyl hydrolase